MNTNRLISEYEHIYKTFYNKYDIIISSPIVVTLVGDISPFSKGDSSILTQKVTLRNYIGYNLNSSNQEIEYIVKENDKGFVYQNIENQYPINQKLLDNIGLKGDIGFFSEYDTINPPSIISNILCLKLLIDDEISIDDFENINLDNLKYKEILDKILNLDKYLLEHFNFFGGIRNNSLYLGTTLLSSDSHMLSIRNNNDYIYKNVGEYSDFNQLDLTFSLVSPNLVTKNNYNSAFLDDKTNNVSSFIEIFGIKGMCKKNISLFTGINNIGNYYSIKLFQDLLKLYGGNHVGNNFYRDLKVYRETLKSLFNNKKDELNDRFIKKQILELIPDKNFNFYMDFFGVFGTIKFAFFNQKTGYIDEELIHKLNKRTGFNLKLDYSSFYDGYEREGVKLEQFRSKGELSMFSSDYVLLTYKNRIIISKSGEYDDFISDNISGLTLDLINRKIYLDGKKLTSKEIHSQNTTVDILQILLDNIGKNVSNKDFLKSSYSSNKNDMLGKIILPLVKLIEKEKKIKLPLTCSGKISEFYLKLENSELEINIVKKIT